MIHIFLSHTHSARDHFPPAPVERVRSSISPMAIDLAASSWSVITVTDGVTSEVGDDVDPDPSTVPVPTRSSIMSQGPFVAS